MDGAAIICTSRRGPQALDDAALDMCDGDECGAERTADGDAGEMGWTGDDRNGRSGWTVYDEGGCSVRGAQGYTGGVHITSPRCWSYVEGEMGREKASSSVGAACEVCTDSVCSKACHRMRLSHLSSASTWNGAGLTSELNFNAGVAG